MTYSQYLKTDHWQRRRKSVLSRDGFKCVACGSEKNLNVHHLFYRPRGMEHKRDLITLCKECHHEEHLLRFRENIKKIKPLLWSKSGKKLNNVELYLMSLDTCPC